MKLLFDASSIFNTLVSKDPSPLLGQYALDFTKYELFNVIWKHHTLLKTYNEEALKILLDSSISILKEMQLLTIDGIEETTMNIATTHGISFYDSAYIVSAGENKCRIVTEDRKMRAICQKIGVSVNSIKEV